MGVDLKAKLTKHVSASSGRIYSEEIVFTAGVSLADVSVSDSILSDTLTSLTHAVNGASSFVFRTVEVDMYGVFVRSDSDCSAWFLVALVDTKASRTVSLYRGESSLVYANAPIFCLDAKSASVDNSVAFSLASYRIPVLTMSYTGDSNICAIPLSRYWCFGVDVPMLSDVVKFELPAEKLSGVLQSDFYVRLKLVAESFGDAPIWFSGGAYNDLRVPLCDIVGLSPNKSRDCIVGNAVYDLLWGAVKLSGFHLHTLLSRDFPTDSLVVSFLKLYFNSWSFSYFLYQSCFLDSFMSTKEDRVFLLAYYDGMSLLSAAVLSQVSVGSDADGSFADILHSARTRTYASLEVIGISEFTHLIDLQDFGRLIVSEDQYDCFCRSTKVLSNLVKDIYVFECTLYTDKNGKMFVRLWDKYDLIWRGGCSSDSLRNHVTSLMALKGRLSSVATL